MNTNQKHQRFTKDLDKLVSDEYVLVPKQANPVEAFDQYLEKICGIDPHDHDNEFGFTTDGLRQMWIAAQTITEGKTI